jgi:hypothetical protein
MAERRLIDVSEIAELLGVSKERASVLCSRKRFPEPVEQVAPLDDTTVDLMRDLFWQRRGVVTFDEAITALENGAYAIGTTGKRLWRLAAVENWAAENWAVENARTVYCDESTTPRHRPATPELIPEWTT